MTRHSSRELGPYELQETLGSGSSAKVYRARNKFLGTEVAVKVLHTPLDDEQAERFLDEARTIARLEHPNIVRVFGFDVEEGIPYLIMEFAPQRSLRQRHVPGTRLPVSTVVSYVKQIAGALQYAHDRGETHLDVKPENMLVGKHGEILLSDFGIGGKIQRRHPDMIHNVVGTVPYMAPEQINGRPDKASDQYALAIVAYEWLVGTYPFVGDKLDIARRHLTARPPSLHARNPQVPPAVERVIMKALSKRPERRYPSVSAFALALEEASRRHPSVLRAGLRPAVNTFKQQRKQPALLAVSFFCVLLMMVFAIAWPIVAAVVHPVNVTITPTSKELAENYTLTAVTNHPDPAQQQVQARIITATSPPASKTVNATGAGIDPGTRAHGLLTFYNGLEKRQIVNQGTVIIASNGVAVTTLVTANIPPADPPSSFGMTTIPAQALNIGSNGNIPTGSINETCCFSDGSITVKNLTPFSGGQDPQPFTFVQQADINGAITALEPGLKTTVQQSLQKQIHPNETNVGTMQCINNVDSNRKVNARTKTVQVTMNVQCSEEVYDGAGAIKLFALLLNKAALQRFGANYVLLGQPAVQFLHAQIKDTSNGAIVLRARVVGIWVYQFSDSQKHALVKLIAGKNTHDATILLLQQAGVSKVAIQTPFWIPWIIRDTLPMDTKRISLNIIQLMPGGKVP